MKIRNNFITNSSSSSYIVAKKNNINKEKLREEFSKEYFKNKELYKCLLESVVQCFGYSEEDFIDEEDNYYDERDLMLEYLKKEDIDEKYIDFLIVFLNSKIINWYFKKMSTNSNVNGYEIDELPIKNISEIDRNLIDNYAKIIIYNNDKEKIDMIDKILYKAYNLTDEEIQLIEDTYK